MPDETESHTLHLLQKIHSKLEEHDERFNAIDKRFDDIGERLENILGAVAGLSFIQSDQRNQIEELAARVERIEGEIGLVETPAE